MHLKLNGIAFSYFFFHSVLRVQLFCIIKIVHIVILRFQITEGKYAKDLKLRSMKRSWKGVL